MKSKVVIFGLVFLGLSSFSLAFAQQSQEGIKIGPANLKTSLEVGGKYDSNIFLESSDRKTDFINVDTPSFLLTLPFGMKGRHKLEAHYIAEIGSFARYTGQNYLNQDVGAGVDLSLPFGYLNVKDGYLNTVDRSATEFTTPVHRLENRADVRLGVELNKLTYEAGYSNLNKHYTNSDYFDYDYSEDVYTLTGFYQAFPKTKALLEYNYGVVGYKKVGDRNATYNQVRVGLLGNLTGKIVGVVKAGYQGRDYDNPNTKNFNNFVAEAGLNMQISEKSKADIRYVWTPMESTYDNNDYYDMNSIIGHFNQKLMGGFSAELLF
ncbi:MAG: outer membrane beta-barrel protein, partial [Candidatus Omnitrophica bacterium]|nr:outer membrane beta-barrel protein [Candidatus Omnitrophota bacterium]